MEWLDGTINPTSFNTVWRTSDADPTAITGGPQSNVDIGVYDDGTGGSPLPNGTIPDNMFVTHRLYVWEGIVTLQFGQVLYSTIDAARGAVESESFQRVLGFEATPICGSLIVRGNATDLADLSQAAFADPTDDHGEGEAIGVGGPMTAHEPILVPRGWPCSLADCPPGPFCSLEPSGKRAGLGVKTEYGQIRGTDVDGRVEYAMTLDPEAYVLESGENWWGGMKAQEARRDQIVQPMIIEWREVDHG